MAVDPLMLSTRLGVEVRTEPPHNLSRALVDERDDVGFARADQDVVGRKDRVRVIAVPMVGPECFRTVDFQVAPDIVGLTRDASAQVLESLSGEAEFVEVVACLPLPDDSPVRCHLIDALVSDDVWAQRGDYARDRHENEAVAVLKQFPVVVLPGGTTRGLGTPLPELVPRPRHLSDGAVAVDAAR
jgi:hypothetical protein